MKIIGWLMTAALAFGGSHVASAQDKSTVTVAGLFELSGAGTIAGTYFKNGVELAFKEINASGGILGREIKLVSFDTQSSPDAAKAKAREAIATRPYAIMGPVFSDMVLATMDEIRQAEIPAFIGGEAASITLQGNPYIFRTSFTQSTAMPKLARYIKDRVRARSVAVVWVQNEFGKGGHDEMVKALEAEGIKVLADIPTQPRQVDFASVVEKIKQSDPDAAFIYLNEEESAHLLRELYEQVYDGSVIGETTLMGQKVVDLAGEAADGVRGHVGLTTDALVPSIRAFHNAFLREYKYKSDHNGMKGYTGAYVLKAVTEKIGKFDSKEFARAMKGVTLLAKDHPGILLDVKFDEKGDLDRTSFIVRVAGGRHQFIATLPPAAGAPAQTPR
jgi:branched-chain amino acid transport system substrate-binding protein